MRKELKVTKLNIKASKMILIIKRTISLFLLILAISVGCLAKNDITNTVSIEYNNMKFTINNRDTINLKDPLKKILRKYKYEVETKGHASQMQWLNHINIYNHYYLKEYPIRFVEHKMSGIAGLDFYINRFKRIEMFNDHKSGVNFNLKIFGYTFNSDTDMSTIEDYLDRNKIKFRKERFLENGRVIYSSLSNSCFSIFIFKNGKLDYCSLSVEKLKKGFIK
jgi:hypothetical protein